MFSRKITETDAFLDMPMSAQCLYFHLNMSADDEGFIGNAKTIKRMIGAGDDDLKLLFAKEFIIPFENGVVVIKDWKIHNYIQKDRFTDTIYQDEKSQLLENENKQYQRFNRADTECIQNVSRMDTQVRLGKDSLGKDRDNTLDATHQASVIDEQFDEWWKTYDKKIDKKKALQKFKLALKKHTFDEIMKGTREYLKTIKDKQYQKYPVTFLNAESYLNEYEHDEIPADDYFQQMIEKSKQEAERFGSIEVRENIE